MNTRTAAISLFAVLVLAACGQTPANATMTANAPVARTAAPASPTPRPPPAVATGSDAIRVARSVISPYVATWRDVVATEERGVWRVAFRHLEPLPPDAPAIEDYWRVPLSVFIDAQTGIVLTQEYR